MYSGEMAAPCTLLLRIVYTVRLRERCVSFAPTSVDAPPLAARSEIRDTAAMAVLVMTSRAMECVESWPYATSWSSPGNIGVNSHCDTRRPPSTTETAPGASTTLDELCRWTERVAQTVDSFGS